MAQPSTRLVRMRELLEGIDDHSIALPAFQRDFEWTDQDVRSMVSTVLRGWPAGSLLTMRGGSSPFFETRPFEFSPPTELDADPRMVVLDGQQRLSALYQAFWDRGPYVYAVDTSAIVDPDVDDIDQAIVSFERGDWERRGLNRQARVTGDLIPLPSLVSSPAFFAWREEIEDRAVAERLASLYPALGAAENYAFPVIELDPYLEAQEIAAIFERLNRTGTALTTFDLVVARSYEPEVWNLRDAWEETRATHPLTAHFLAEDGLPILQTIALLSRGDVRQSAVLRLEPSVVQSYWSRASQGVEGALDFLYGRCGVREIGWLPYRGMLLPLAALATEDLLTPNHVGVLDRWFWSVAFGLGYEVAANTALVSDYRSLEGALRRKEDLSVPRIHPGIIFDASRRRPAAIWRAFQCALAANGAQDLSGETLNYMEPGDEASRPPDIVAGSIYKAQDSPPSMDPPAHQRVLGLVLMNRQTRAVVRRRGLQGVLADTEETYGHARTQEVLQGQFLPSPGEVELSNIELFLQTRLKSVLEFLGARGAAIDDL